MEEGVVKEMWAHSHKSNNTNEAATSSSNNGPDLFTAWGGRAEKPRSSADIYTVKTDFLPPLQPPKH